MRDRISAQLLVLSVFAALRVKCSGQGITLGVLEESGGHYFGEPNYRSVRVVFRKNAGQWEPFPSDCRDQECLKSATSSYPDEVKWTITFDGRNVGKWSVVPRVISVITAT